MVEKEIRKKISLMEENSFATKNFKYSSLIPNNMKSLKKKRIYTPNLNVVRKPKCTPLEKPDEKKTKPKKRENTKKEKAIQPAEVFWEGTKHTKPHRTDKARKCENKIKKIKVGGLLLSHNRLESPPSSSESDACEEIEPKDGKFDFIPFDLVNNIKQKIPIACIVKDEHDTEEYNSLVDGGESTSVKDEKVFLPGAFGNESRHHPALTVFKLPDYISCKNKVGISINELHEGKLGKLCIRRSGKMEARLGKLKCKVDRLDYITNPTDVVSFVNNNEPASLVVLGTVQNWFSIVPAWDNMVVK